MVAIDWSPANGFSRQLESVSHLSARVVPFSSLDLHLVLAVASKHAYYRRYLF